MGGYNYPQESSDELRSNEATHLKQIMAKVNYSHSSFGMRVICNNKETNCITKDHPQIQ